MEVCLKTKLYLRILIVLVIISMAGAFKPVIFNGGSSTAKYLAKQNQLEMVAEEKAEDYFEAVVFGEGEANLDNFESIPEEDRTEAVESIFGFDRVIAIFLLLGTSLLLIPRLSKSPLYHILLLDTLWLLILSVSVSLNGGKKFSEIALLAHATRWGLPFILWWVIFNLNKSRNFSKELSSAVFILLICSSLTFAVHGWEALSLNPSFQDLIFNFGALLGITVTENSTAFILKSVGCMDIILAASIFFIRSPKIFLWMAFWGLITAFSRPLTLGLEAWPEAAMRIANCGLPFMLYLLYRKSKEPADTAEKLKQNMEITCEQT